MIAVDTISKGDGSRISNPRRVIVRDEDGWRALWAEHAGGDVLPPYVDFVNPDGGRCVRRRNAVGRLQPLDCVRPS